MSNASNVTKAALAIKRGSGIHKRVTKVITVEEIEGRKQADCGSSIWEVVQDACPPTTAEDMHPTVWDDAQEDCPPTAAEDAGDTEVEYSPTSPGHSWSEEGDMDEECPGYECCPAEP